MNFLAHLYLAGQDEGLIIGNFIADGIRGKEIFNYPENIQKGIILHRKIDQYTDTHPVVKKTVTRLRNSAGKYAPVVSDVVYDHFLAANWKDYSPIELQDFAQSNYSFLQKNIVFIPEKMHLLLEYMIKQNWLVNYGSLHGIARTLRDLQKRVHFANTMALSINDLKNDYDSFLTDFRDFIPDLQEYVTKEIKAGL